VEFIQKDYLREMLDRLTEYKESYYDKGVDIINEDINQLIREVREVHDEAAQEVRGSKLA